MREFPIGGLYEACIGVREMLPQIQYWERFGYHVDRIGGLTAEAARRLYGVESAFRAVRLGHLDSDHGFIRLMEWAQPLNDGLGLAPLGVKGSRWVTQMTANLLDLMNHVVEAEKAGLPLRYIEPQWDVIYQEQSRGRPFHDSMVGVREMYLLQPLARQVLFERFNYIIANYGKLNYSCLFQTSQAVHFGLVLEDEGREALRFYDQTLGLLRARDNNEYTYAVASGRVMFDLKLDQRYVVTDFDDPRSSTEWREMRSGRLHIIRFPSSGRLADWHAYSRPGCLGFSLYTYRVSGLENYHERVTDGGASNITDIFLNEFGERSFSFTAPDGYFWTLVED